jgi:hypothetical protein
MLVIVQHFADLAEIANENGSLQVGNVERTSLKDEFFY